MIDPFIRDCIVVGSAVVGGLFNIWYVGYRVGKIRAGDRQAIHGLVTSMAQASKERDKQANKILRLFMAIEEIRRKTNGNTEWRVNLIGGDE